MIVSELQQRVVDKLSVDTPPGVYAYSWDRFQGLTTAFVHAAAKFLSAGGFVFFASPSGRSTKGFAKKVERVASESWVDAWADRIFVHPHGCSLPDCMPASYPGPWLLVLDSLVDNTDLWCGAGVVRCLSNGKDEHGNHRYVKVVVAADIRLAEESKGDDDDDDECVEQIVRGVYRPAGWSPANHHQWHVEEFRAAVITMLAARARSDCVVSMLTRDALLHVFEVLARHYALVFQRHHATRVTGEPLAGDDALHHLNARIQRLYQNPENAMREFIPV